MNIFWQGQTCFKIIVQKGKEGQVSILVNPYGKETGLRPPKVEADILILSDDSRKEVQGCGFLVAGPGEYDVKGVYIKGIPALAKSTDPKNKKDKKKTTIYAIEAEDIRICYLDNLGEEELSSKELEDIGGADVLIVPVGGQDSLDAKGAIKVMSQIEPKIIIPMYYKIPGLKIKLDAVETFLKSLGIKTLEPVPKLSIKKKDIQEGEAKIIVLQP
jgi:L-ascorbate metabolism protein UlaG (beta-lactamase superfamily)